MKEEEVRTDKVGIMSFSVYEMRRRRRVSATKRDEWVSKNRALRLT